jgi:hypothetical protein
VDRRWRRTLLGFTFVGRQFRRRVSEKALKALRWKLKRLTRRTRGRSLRRIIDELRELLFGCLAYFDFGKVPSPLRDLETWIRRRLRCYAWTHWGRRGYRELRRLRVSSELGHRTARVARVSP